MCQQSSVLDMYINQHLFVQLVVIEVAPKHRRQDKKKNITITLSNKSFIQVSKCLQLFTAQILDTGMDNIFTCKLAISERPARLQTILAGGFASASHLSTRESLPSSKSIWGDPSNLIVGKSICE